jgi:hypothetical protein
VTTMSPPHEKTVAQPDACDNPTSTITPTGGRVISVPRKRALLQEYGVLIQETVSGDLFRFTCVPPHAFKSTINDHASALMKSSCRRSLVCKFMS